MRPEALYAYVAERDPLRGEEAPVEDRVRDEIFARIVAEDPREPAPRRRRRRRPPRRLAVVLALLVAVGGTAIAAGIWNPTIGTNRTGHPKVSTTPLPAAELAAIGALRRAQTPADRGRDSEAVLRMMVPAYDNGVHLASVRLLTTWPPGGFAVLVPVDTTTVNPGGLDGLPQFTGNGLCLFITAPPLGDEPDTGNNGYGELCGTVADIRAGRLVIGAEIGGRLQLVGVAPDGVARVRIALHDGTAVTAPVLDNAFHFDVRVAPGAYGHAPLQWLDAHGNEVSMR
jgi:hypothetical protein